MLVGSFKPVLLPQMERTFTEIREISLDLDDNPQMGWKRYL